MTSATGIGTTRAPRPSSLADVLDLILDKGIVIDAYVRVSVVGIELLTIDARIVIASVDTYLRFAEAANRLDLQPQGQVTGLPGMVQGITEGGAEHKTHGALTGAKESVKETASEIAQKFHGSEEEEEERPRRRTTASRQAPRRRRRAEEEEE